MGSYQVGCELRTVTVVGREGSVLKLGRLGCIEDCCTYAKVAGHSDPTLLLRAAGENSGDFVPFVRDQTDRECSRIPQ